MIFNTPFVPLVHSLDPPQKKFFLQFPEYFDQS